MKPTCALIVLRPDGMRETLHYDAYTAMKYDARSAKRRKAGMVLYWWCEWKELKGHERT